MADIHILAPFILSWEGTWSDHPQDRGGATNRGVTIGTWRSIGYDIDQDGDIDTDDLRLITDTDAIEHVLRPHYWNRWKADHIRSQSIANILVDWTWASGSSVIRPVQRILGVTPDGKVGPVTLQAIDKAPAPELFATIHRMRRDRIEEICRRTPSQKVFRKGWLRRLDAIAYGTLHDNGAPTPRTFPNP